METVVAKCTEAHLKSVHNIDCDDFDFTKPRITDIRPQANTDYNNGLYHTNNIYIYKYNINS